MFNRVSGATGIGLLVLVSNAWSAPMAITYDKSPWGFRCGRHSVFCGVAVTREPVPDRSTLKIRVLQAPSDGQGEIVVIYYLKEGANAKIIDGHQNSGSLTDPIKTYNARQKVVGPGRDERKLIKGDLIELPISKISRRPGQPKESFKIAIGVVKEGPLLDPSLESAPDSCCNYDTGLHAAHPTPNADGWYRLAFYAKGEKEIKWEFEVQCLSP